MLLVGVIAVLVAAVNATVYLADVGDQVAQVLAFRIQNPALAVVAVLLYRRVAKRLEAGTGARRYWGLMQCSAGALAVANCLGLVIAVTTPTWEFPITALPVQCLNILTGLFAIAALLAVPVRQQDAAARLRVSLDLVIVLLSAVTFMWYLSIAPAAQTREPVLLALVMVQAGVVLVVVFAAARLLLKGSRGVHPAALALFGSACVLEVAREALAVALPGPQHLHLLMSAGMLFYVLSIASPLAELVAGRSADDLEARRTRPFSLLPYLSIAATMGLLVVAMLGNLDVRTRGVLTGAVALTALVVLRQTVALRDNARLLIQLDRSLVLQQRAMRREQVLAEAGTALMSARDSTRMFQIAADTALSMAGASGRTRAMVSIVAPDRSARVAAVAGDGADEARGAQFGMAGHAASVLARLRAGHVVESVSADLGIRMVGGASAKQGTLVLLPLTGDADELAVLSVASDGDIPAELRKSLETLRTQVALAVEGAALVAELGRRAMQDELTGLANRAAFHERLEQATARSRRTGRATAVLLLDLDGFKQVNDSLGHAAGDHLLRVVAQRLATTVRPSELVARLGGDEFAVVAEDLAGPRDAKAIAERIGAALVEPAYFDGHRLTIRCSIGTAMHDADPEELVRAADAAMYRAKRRSDTATAAHTWAYAEDLRSGSDFGA